MRIESGFLIFILIVILLITIIISAIISWKKDKNGFPFFLTSLITALLSICYAIEDITLLTTVFTLISILLLVISLIFYCIKGDK